MVKGLEEQIPTEEYGTVLLCDNSKACVEAVEAGKGRRGRRDLGRAGVLHL